MPRRASSGWSRTSRTGKKDEERLRLASIIFDSTTECIMVTDSENRIVTVNPAFTAITGYAADDVIGKDPEILRSDRHDTVFFEKMWESLRDSDRWEGEIWNARKSGEAFPAWMSIVVVRDDNGDPGRCVAVFSDISRRKRDEERISYHANYDSLTDLPNRRLFQDRLRLELAHAAGSGHQAALLYVDLDNFKVVNESLGHAVGDALLVKMAERFKSCLGEGDTLSRIGGDVFVALLSHIHSAEETILIARDLLKTLSKPQVLDGREIVITASIGIALFPGDGDTPGDLIRNAGSAGYHAKERGRNTYQFFTEDMNVRAMERLSMENKLRRALERDELVLHYQPKVELRRGGVVGVEALVRWQSPEEGLVPPDRFIPLAEETGLIVPLGDWVLRQACAQAKKWLDAGLPAMPMAVNMSARQLTRRTLLADIARILEQTGLPPEFLELEITESSLMERIDETAVTLCQLRDMGIHLTADDFGTGYSSLNYLRSFPLDSIKIDQSFVSDIGVASDESGAEGLVSAVIGIGQSLDLKVIAEGVENHQQLAFLRQQWCDQIQGFLFSRPVPADDFATLLGDARRL
jgi:diguanylate cyclase (GGDEF)-like protein/PAS domain S-box-containing protein